MQKKDGTDAKGLTQEEFSRLMGQLMAEVESGAADDPTAFPLGYAIISLDNCKAHAAYQRAVEAISPDRLNRIPAHSPDIHKVVEHPLSPFNKHWYEEFSLDVKVKNCYRSMELASEILRRTTAESIANDVASIPDTLRSIIANGGDWADKHLC